MELILNDNKLNDVNKICHNRDSENEKLHKQNLKLIHKLEKVTCELVSSQIKIKELELENMNICKNGNVNSFLVLNKNLEEDNKRLCEELKYQISLNQVLSKSEACQENNCNSVEKMENLKDMAENKIAKLKKQIQEIQKQNLKSQKILQKNEYNYKLGQIGILETLKKITLENESLKEKISSLKIETDKNLELQGEILHLKSNLNQNHSELKILITEIETLKENLVESEKICQTYIANQRTLENEMINKEKDFDKLIQENQELHKRLEKINSNEIVPKPVTSNDEFMHLVRNLDQLKIEKLEMENDCLNKVELIKQSEIEIQKLRIEVEQLNAVKCDFDFKLKSKLNEIENFSCQLLSTTQRLEIREKRINELVDQLSTKSAEESVLKTRLTKEIDKNNHLESEILNYKSELSTLTDEKCTLLKNINGMESVLAEKCAIIENIGSRLNQAVLKTTHLEQSLESQKSSYCTLIQELKVENDVLKDKNENSKNAINVYEKENGILEKKLEDVTTELKTCKNEEERITRTSQEDLEKCNLQIVKKNEVIEKYKLQITEQKHAINDFENQLKEMQTKIVDRNKQIGSLSSLSVTQNEELSVAKLEILNLHKQLQNNKEFSENNKILKSKCNKKKIKIEKMKKDTSDLNEKIECVTKTLVEEKRKSELIQLNLTKTENELEKLKVKIICSQQDLEHKRKSFQDLNEKYQLEKNQIETKLQSNKMDRDKLSKNLRLLDEENIKLQSQLKKIQIEQDSLKEIILTQKEDVSKKEKLIKRLELEILNLHEHLKSSQFNVVDRSREIDRLEQLVRDLYEQIEIRSGQLQSFELDLQCKLRENQEFIQQSKENEMICGKELEIVKEKNEDINEKLYTANQQNEKLLEDCLKTEKKCETFIKSIEVLEDEKKTFLENTKSLREELISKTSIIENLLQEMENKNKTIDDLSDDLESKVASTNAKNWQIRQLEEQLKNYKKNFTEVEVKLKTEIKIMQRKLDSFQLEKAKEIDFTISEMVLKIKNQSEELHCSKLNLEKISLILEEMRINLMEKEEHVAELKIQITNQSAVMTNLENNCQLKQVVIERLLQKINEFTLLTLHDSQNKDLSIELDDCSEIRTNPAIL